MKQTIQAQVLDHLFEGVYFVNRNREILLWNRAAEKLTGFKASDVIGRQCADAILRHVSGDGTLLCHNGCPLQATLDDGRERETEVYLHHMDGHRVPIHVRVAPVHGDNGEVIGAVEMFRDARREQAHRERFEQLEKMAFIDPLTGLPNRRYLMDTIEMRLNELKRYKWPFGLLFMDVDHFKKVNDAYGHKIGDNVLKMVANTLKSSARSHDLVGRAGGEEFVAVVTNVEADQLVLIADRFRTLVERSALRDPKDLGVTISIGAAMAKPGDTCETLMERSDALLYKAKQSGRNNIFE